MEINKIGFITALKLRASGDRGWSITTCMFCGKKDRLGVMLDTTEDRKPHFHCFKCGRAGSLKFLAKHIGRPELVSGEYVAPMTMEMEIDTEINMDMPVCSLPIAFRRTSDHFYLDERSISAEQRDRYKFGITKLDPKVKNDYMVTLVEEGGLCLGYVARSFMSKDWIDEYNRTHDNEYPRYKNSKSDFSKLIFGLNDIEIDETHTMIITEGMYDKLAVDRKLNLYQDKSIKCGCSFGTKLSDIQAMKIAMTGVENVIILYDEGTVDKSKKVSALASSYFRSVKISTLNGGDPDEVSEDVLIDAIVNTKSVTEYSLTELPDVEI